jgi:hypothetical protein
MEAEMPCRAGGVTEMRGKSFRETRRRDVDLHKGGWYADSKEDRAFNQSGPLGQDKPFRKSVVRQRQNRREGKERG